MAVSYALGMAPALRGDAFATMMLVEERAKLPEIFASQGVPLACGGKAAHLSVLEGWRTSALGMGSAMRVSMPMAIAIASSSTA